MMDFIFYLNVKMVNVKKIKQEKTIVKLWIDY